MTTTYGPIPAGTEMEEENGTVKRLVIQYTVTGVTGTNIARLGDALSAAGIPDYNDEAVGYDYLLCTRRTVRPNPTANDGHTMDVFVEYTPKGLEGNNFYGTYSSTLTQIETQNDFNGNPISVAYTYPANYPYDTTLAGQTVTQGGAVSVQIPQPTIVISGIYATDYPNSVTDYWMGTTNLWAWNGGGPGQWLVASVTCDPEALGTNPSRWKFRFEFQRKLDGWQPLVYFIDPNDGKPPADLVENVGVKYVNWYPTRIFQTWFP